LKRKRVSIATGGARLISPDIGAPPVTAPVTKPGATPSPGIAASASEDFACIAEKIPSVFIYLSAGYPDDRGLAPAHNPKVQFNEDVCPIGASYYAHCATQWLKNNK
jgi:metal-dependent amidase/aminoacylase/carboxypeptidase family protein